MNANSVGLFNIKDHILTENRINLQPSLPIFRMMLSELVSPAAANQMAYYRQLGLRSRVLNLPLMVSAVLTMLWRQVPYSGLDLLP
jgi:hypothetical protein